MGTGSFPGLKWLGRGVDHPPHLTPRLRKQWSYTSIPLWGFVVCSRVNFTFTIPIIHVQKYELRQTFVNNSVSGKTQNLKKEVEAPHETSATVDNGQCQIKQE
jgi:hypothetical protein